MGDEVACEATLEGWYRALRLLRPLPAPSSFQGPPDASPSPTHALSANLAGIIRNVAVELR